MEESIKYLTTIINLDIEKNNSSKNFLSGEEACYSIYQTKDNLFMALGAFEKHYFDLFVTTLGLTELSSAHMNKTYKNESVKEIIAKAIIKKTQKEWSEIFKNIDCCFTPVVPSQYQNIIFPFKIIS